MRSTEERILEAAREMFLKRGYRGTTTRVIAKKAGVSEVTVFRKFGSKKNILRAILDENSSLILRTLESMGPREVERPEDFLLKLGNELMKLISTNKIDLIFIILAEKELEEHGSEELKLPDSLNKVVYNFLSNYFKNKILDGTFRKINPETAAVTYISYVSHLSLISHLTEDKIDAQRLLKEFVEILLNGCLNPHLRGQV